jgi:hypothetical protein
MMRNAMNTDRALPSERTIPGRIAMSRSRHLRIPSFAAALAMLCALCTLAQAADVIRRQVQGGGTATGVAAPVEPSFMGAVKSY